MKTRLVAAVPLALVLATATAFAVQYTDTDNSFAPAFVQIPIAGSDGSTTITAGGTAQNLFAGVTPLRGWEVCDPNSGDELWVSDSTTAAPNGAGSYRVPPNGGCYRPPASARPNGAVSVYGATTGDKITARQW